MSGLPKLYDAVIKSHDYSPYNFRKMGSCSHSVSANNFICGDRFDICIEMSDRRIASIHFYGFGCAVSKASTSVLVKHLEGKSTTEAHQICNQFLRLLKNELNDGEQLLSPEFDSFRVVHEIPARYDCAALAWVEVDKFLSH